MFGLYYYLNGWKEIKQGNNGYKVFNGNPNPVVPFTMPDRKTMLNMIIQCVIDMIIKYVANLLRFQINYEIPWKSYV